MGKYTVRITEKLIKDLHISANSQEEAIAKVQDVYCNVGIEINEVSDVEIEIADNFQYDDDYPIDAWIDGLLEMSREDQED